MIVFIEQQRLQKFFQRDGHFFLAGDLPENGRPGGNEVPEIVQKVPGKIRDHKAPEAAFPFAQGILRTVIPEKEDCGHHEETRHCDLGKMLSQQRFCQACCAVLSRFPEKQFRVQRVCPDNQQCQEKAHPCHIVTESFLSHGSMITLSPVSIMLNTISMSWLSISTHPLDWSFPSKILQPWI